MIKTQALSFFIGDFKLNQINMEIPEGEYFVLLGRPGSGKTTFLECLCGLNHLNSGKVYIDGKDVTNLEPRKRGIGYVPQDYALFLHLSTKQNIAFSLRSRKIPHEEINRKVLEKASLLEIEHLLTRDVRALSGGEKQRVALARALVMEPKVLLLDEPVSALDESTRNAVCIKLRKLQKDLGITTIHICHNLEEAFTVAERGGILNNGAFEQIGPINELLRKPANEFSARFMRCENVFSAHPEGAGPIEDSTCVQVNNTELIVPGKHTDNIQFIIRPEDIQLQKIDNCKVHKKTNQFLVQLVRTVDCGVYMRLDLSGDFPLVVYLSHYLFQELQISEGNEVMAILKINMIHVMPRLSTNEYKNQILEKRKKDE